MNSNHLKIKLVAAITLLVGLIFFNGCQTVKGAGKDIEKTGEHI